MLIYKLKWSFFERYKITNRPWPLDENKERWNKLIKETTLTLLINQVLLLPLLNIKNYFSGTTLFRTDYSSLPSTKELIIQTMFFFLSEDFFFYWSDRLLHWDKIYSYVHKQHHNYVDTVSLASEFAHPLEFLLGNCLTSCSGALILERPLTFILICFG